MPVDTSELVVDRSFEFVWSPGFAVSQKQKNVAALHEAAGHVGVAPVLEVSTRSREELGYQLSAFNLLLETQAGEVPVENAFQASKVYEHGGPYLDLYEVSSKDARRDSRHRSSGTLIGFNFFGGRWSLVTGTLFYDWLYLRALQSHDGADDLLLYAGFTDIEFNPEKSLNCQARSCALFVSLSRGELLDDALSDYADLRDVTALYVASAMQGNQSFRPPIDQQRFGGSD